MIHLEQISANYRHTDPPMHILGRFRLRSTILMLLRTYEREMGGTHTAIPTMTARPPSRTAITAVWKVSGEPSASSATSTPAHKGNEQRTGLGPQYQRQYKMLETLAIQSGYCTGTDRWKYSESVNAHNPQLIPTEGPKTYLSAWSKYGLNS